MLESSSSSVSILIATPNAPHRSQLPLKSLSQKRHHEINHHVLLGRLRFSDHHRQRNERVIGDALRAVLAQQESVAFQKIKEERGRNALVAVGEAVVLRDEVEEIRRPRARDIASTGSRSRQGDSRPAFGANRGDREDVLIDFYCKQKESR